MQHRGGHRARHAGPRPWRRRPRRPRGGPSYLDALLAAPAGRCCLATLLALAWAQLLVKHAFRHDLGRDRKTTTGLKCLLSGALVSVSVLLLPWVPSPPRPKLRARPAPVCPSPSLGREVRSSRPELQRLGQLICSGHSPPEGVTLGQLSPQRRHAMVKRTPADAFQA